MINKISVFLKEDIWKIKQCTLPPTKAFLLNQLRIILLALKGFTEDKCHFRASALTFYTLLSIVPVVAMFFGIARGFGVEKILETQLRESLHGHEEVADKILNFATSLLQNTRSGVIVGIGILFLF